MANGVGRVGWRGYVSQISTLWNNLVSAWNGDALATTLDTNIYRVYNGDDVNDSSGNGRHGTNIGGVTFTTGKIGNAFTFNGSNYIALPDNTFSSLTGDFTISLWWYVKFVNDQSLISNMQRISGNNYGWYLYYDSGWMYFKMGSGAASYSVISKDFVSVVPTQNVWAHITIVRKAGQSTKMYVNGVDVNAAQTIGLATTDPSYYSTQKCAIGNVWYSYYDSYVKSGAKIDAVNVWNRALNVGEIVSLYNLGNGTEYPFSTQTLPTPNDVYGVNHGTLMNGATFTTGKIGSSFTFDGVNDYVSLPNNSLNLTGDFSGSAWVYVPSGYIGTSTIYMFCNLWAPSWAINFKGWRFYTYGDSVGFSVADGSSYNGNSGIYNLTYAVGGGGIPRDVWTHFAFTRKAGVGSKIYMNGSLVASDTNTVNQVYNTTHTPTVGNMYIPGVQNSYYAPANTRIDALNIWNKELKASEVTELYNSGNGKQYPN